MSLHVSSLDFMTLIFQTAVICLSKHETDVKAFDDERKKRSNLYQVLFMDQEVYRRTLTLPARYFYNKLINNDKDLLY